MEKNIRKENSNYYSYLFHYNGFSNKWNCFLREDMINYFNNKSLIKIGIGDDVHSAYQNIKQLENESKREMALGSD